MRQMMEIVWIENIDAPQVDHWTIKWQWNNNYRLTTNLFESGHSTKFIKRTLTDSLEVIKSDKIGLILIGLDQQWEISRTNNSYFYLIVSSPFSYFL